MEQLDRETRQLGQSNQQINDQGQSVAASTEEISTTLSAITDATRQLSGQVAQTLQSASDGATTLQEAVTGLKETSQVVANIEQKLNKLESLSSDIDSVLDMINNLASQTNLLALNAAIEAARAGEQGRGFAVVADEVRTLASRTQASTEEIRVKVDTVMAGSRNAVGSISTSVSNANEISDRVGSVQEAFNDYLTYIARISQLNGQVSVTTDEQQAVSEDITQRTHTISNSGADVAADFESTAQRASELEKIASHLDQAIKRFQL
jgi:methyl-accepting chemotaxis protein